MYMLYDIGYYMGCDIEYYIMYYMGCDIEHDMQYDIEYYMLCI